jgi:hypothetical protein
MQSLPYGIPSTATPLKPTIKGVKPYAWQEGGQWQTKTLLPSGSAIGRKNLYGWSPFSSGLPWVQKPSIGSDAMRQGSYLGGITQTTPQISWMGKYQDLANTYKPFGTKGYNNPYRAAMGL